jgi:hypothetical protein
LRFCRGAHGAQQPKNAGFRPGQKRKNQAEVQFVVDPGAALKVINELTRGATKLAKEMQRSGNYSAGVVAKGWLSKSSSKDPRSCVGKWEERFFVLSGGAIPKVCSFKKKRSLWEIGSRRGEFAAVALQALDRDSMLMRGVGRPAGLLRLRGGLRAAAGEHQGCQLKGSWGFYRTPSHPVEDPLDPLQIGKAP